MLRLGYDSDYHPADKVLSDHEHLCQFLRSCRSSDGLDVGTSVVRQQRLSPKRHAKVENKIHRRQGHWNKNQPHDITARDNELRKERPRRRSYTGTVGFRKRCRRNYDHHHYCRKGKPAHSLLSCHLIIFAIHISIFRVKTNR